MKLKKITIKYIAAAALCLSIAGITVSSVSAATYSTSHTRGIKYLCWSKDEIVWKTNSKKITDVDKNQSRSGLLVVNKGITKYSSLSSNTKHVYLCKHTLVVGAELNGITIGWNTDVNDRVAIFRSGKASWTENV